MKAEPRHERTDASVRTIAITAGSLAALILIGLLVGWRMVLAAPSAGRAATLGAAGLFQHGAEARTDIALAWERVDARTRQRLGTYGWVDRKAGVVRIPIEQAMERTAAKGAWDR